jgi:hypothetical protein
VWQVSIYLIFSSSFTNGKDWQSRRSMRTMSMKVKEPADIEQAADLVEA